MEIKKSITEDKKFHISFTFNPEEYVLSNWDIMEKVNEVIVQQIIAQVVVKHKDELLDFFKKEKKKIIENAKEKLVESFNRKIEQIIDEERD